MGIFSLIKEARAFKTHDHITVSGNGVISTTADHYMKSAKAKKAAKDACEMLHGKRSKEA